MRYRSVMAVSIVLCAAAACAPAPLRQTTLEEDRQAIEELHDRHVAAARAKDVDAFLATVTDDFVLMPPNDPGARGKEAARAWYLGMFGAFSITALQFPTAELQIDEDWAFKHYSYDWTVSPDAGGDSVSDRGNGLYVYHRQADGSWKVAYDIWTSSEPIPGSD